MVCLQSLHSVGVVTIVFFVYMPFLVRYHFVIKYMVFVYIFLYIFFSFGFTWCMCCGDYGLCFGGGSYSAVYVPPPFFCVPYGPYTTYSFIFFLFLCSVYSFLHSSSLMCFPSYFCVVFPCLDENFWGVWVRIVYMYYMQPYMYFEMGILDIFFYSCYNWPG